MLAASHEGLQVDLRSEQPVRLLAKFDCAPGELVALVGASGSGKTTQSPDLAGHVRLGSQTWMDSAHGIQLSAQQRRVGLVFQHYALFPHLSAINNIALCAHSITAINSKDLEEIAQNWLARLGMAALAHRLPHELSGGQQQRVALARAPVRMGVSEELSGGVGEGVLLLDEPFSAVDAPMRQVLYRELAQLRQNFNIPIVLVTHDLHEARRLANSIVIIDAGQSLQSGSPAHVMRSPRNARVAQLVGIHNHFSAHFHRHQASSAQAQLGELHWGDLRLRVADKGKIDDNTAVTWVLAGEAVQLHGAQAEMDEVNASVNRLNCRFTEMLPLGEISLCRLAVHGTPDTIQLNLPTASLASMGLRSGDEAVLAVPPESVHIMPIRT
jgi:molybdate transport system ATP-binding protein